MSWKDDASAVMHKVMQAQKRAGITDAREIAAAIDSAYPFGERAHWPYKAWLSARREFFTIFGLPLARSSAEARRQLNTEPTCC